MPEGTVAEIYIYTSVDLSIEIDRVSWPDSTLIPLLEIVFPKVGRRYIVGFCRKLVEKHRP